MVLDDRQIKQWRLKTFRGQQLDTVLVHFCNNLVEFLRQYIIVDETWIHRYYPKTKAQSKQWVFEGEQAPKKVKTVKSVSKVIATVCWDTCEIIYTDYLRNTNDYCRVLRVVIVLVKRQSQEKASTFEKQEDSLTSRQCTGAQLCAVSTAKIMELKLE